MLKSAAISHSDKSDACTTAGKKWQIGSCRDDKGKISGKATCARKSILLGEWKMGHFISFCAARLTHQETDS